MLPAVYRLLLPLLLALACVPDRTPLAGKTCAGTLECGPELTCLAGVCAAPPADRWLAGPELPEGLVFHGATRLAEGGVLLTGGRDPSGAPRRALIYDPALATTREVAPLLEPRSAHASVLLPGGRVLVAGGVLGETEVKSTEIYDPALDRWQRAGDLLYTHAEFTLFVLPDGRVLTFGSSRGREFELFDPVTGAWEDAADPEGFYSATAPVQLKDGSVLALNQLGVERFDPGSGTWTRLATTGSASAYNQVTAALPSGQVLVAGGASSAQKGLASAELLDPGSGSFESVTPMSVAREDHTATLLPDGRVLVLGGVNAGGTPAATLGSAELFDPERKAWTEAPALEFPRTAHRATLLLDGSVLVTGGRNGAATVTRAERYFP